MRHRLQGRAGVEVASAGLQALVGRPIDPTAAELLREFFDETPADLKWYRGRGCSKCDFTGYKGRRVVVVLWVPSNADIILINKSAPRDELVESATNSTYSMAETALHLLKEGATNLEELMRTLPYATIYRMRSLVAA